MYKLCKTEQSAARQRRLEEGLLQAMLAQRYDEISVSDLCDRMEIPRKSFYRYFSGKDGALYALLDHSMMEYESFNAVYCHGERRTLQRELMQFFLFWKARKPLLDALERSGMSGVLIERAIGFAVSDTVVPSRFLPDETQDMQKQITMFGVCGLLSMVLAWHHADFDKTPEELARIGARLIGQPLFPGVENIL